MKTALMLSLMLFALTAHAETRGPNAREIASFETWHAQRYPGAGPIKPQFEIQREKGEREWRITATVDAAPQRGAWSLCSATRSKFAYDLRAQPKQRWSAVMPAERYVWLDRKADCSTPGGRVQLKQTMPDRDIVTLLEQQGQLLQGARLLFAGNSQCAVQRALAFQLQAIDIGADRLYRLSYQSDRGGNAHVSVRKRGRELTAWNVTCPR